MSLGNRGLGVWVLLVAAAILAIVSFAGCRERTDYEPPEYAPPPPPPPPVGLNSPQPGSVPLEKVDPLTLPPKLNDPQDVEGGGPDLKSVIAGFRDNDLALSFETYGPPPMESDIWFLCWLSTPTSTALYKVQISLGATHVVGSKHVGDTQDGGDQLLSSRVRAEGNKVIASFAWEKLPEDFRLRALQLNNPTIIQSGGDGQPTKVVDRIEGSDQVRL